MDKLIIVIGALLIAFALWQVIRRFSGRSKGSSCCGSAEAVTVKKVEDTDASHYPYHYRLSIEGMMCSNCARNVENTLNSMQGVWGRVDLGKNEADVLAKEPVEKEAFESAFSETSYSLAGYTAVADQA